MAGPHQVALTQLASIYLVPPERLAADSLQVRQFEPPGSLKPSGVCLISRRPAVKNGKMPQVLVFQGEPSVPLVLCCSQRSSDAYGQSRRRPFPPCLSRTALLSTASERGP